VARHEKHTADYFPFVVKDGKTLFVLETQWGATGTGVFTNVLRFLCATPDHHYRISDPGDRLYFFSRLHIDESTGMQMLTAMSKTGKLDKELFDHGVIFCHDLVDSLRDAYQKRTNKEPMSREQILAFYSFPDTEKPFPEEETRDSEQSGPGSTQSKVKKKKINTPLPPALRERFDLFYASYPKKKSRGQAEKAFSRINPDEQLLRTILSAIERAKKSEDWTKENGRYIPHPATWLNAKGWEDEIEVKTTGPLPAAHHVVKTNVCPHCGNETTLGLVDGHCERCLPRKPRGKDGATIGDLTAGIRAAMENRG